MAAASSSRRAPGRAAERLALTLATAVALDGCASMPSLPHGTYCAREPLVGDTGSATFPLGDFAMKLDVEEHHGRTTISFWNSMPDSGEILAAGPVEARAGPGGSLRFAFRDGWGNVGAGLLRPNATVTLDLTQPSPDPLSSNVGRNYGTYQLSRAACASFDAGDPDR